MPWEHSALTGRFFFKERAAIPAASKPPPDELAAMRAQLKRLEEQMQLARSKEPGPALKQEATAPSQVAAPKPEAKAASPAPPKSGPKAAAADTAKPPSEQQIAAWRTAAKPRSFRLQSYFSDAQPGFATALLALSGTKLKVEWLKPGAAVPVSEQFDAIASGKLDMGWSSPGLWWGKAQALAIFGGQVPSGHEPERLVRWMRVRGERELNAVYQDVLKFNVHALSCGLGGPEGIWFKKPISSVRDLRNVSVRTVGLPHGVLNRLGMSAKALGAAEIIQAFEKGTIEAAEFGNPLLDDDLGLPRVAKNFYYPSFHAPAAMAELLINRDRWSALVEEEKALMRESCRRVQDGDLRSFKGLADKGIGQIKAKGVTVRELPKDIYEPALNARDEIVKEISDRDPLFKKTWESYSTFR